MDDLKVATERDPVCGKLVSLAEPGVSCSYKGREYHFCSSDCQGAFEKKPDKYLKSKGFIARFLERLARSNQAQFGDKGPTCCN